MVARGQSPGRLRLLRLRPVLVGGNCHPRHVCYLGMLHLFNGISGLFRFAWLLAVRTGILHRVQLAFAGQARVLHVVRSFSRLVRRCVAFTDFEYFIDAGHLAANFWHASVLGRRSRYTLWRRDARSNCCVCVLLLIANCRLAPSFSWDLVSADAQKRAIKSVKTQHNKRQLARYD